MKSKKGTRLGPGGRWLEMLGTSSPGAPTPVSERRLMETIKGDVVEGKLCEWCRAGAGEQRCLFRFSWQILGGVDRPLRM